MQRTEERVDPGLASTQLKQLSVLERPAPMKKVKVTKKSVDPIMLTEGDLFDIDKTIHDVTKDALQEMMME